LREEKSDMPVTTLTREVTATSQIGPEEAVTQAIAGVTAEMTGVKHVEVKQVEVLLHNTKVAGYRVTLEVSHEGEVDPTNRREDDSAWGWSPDHPAAAQLPLGPEPLPLHADEAGVVRVGGTRVALDSVVAAFWSGETAEGIVERYPALRLADVYQVLGYYLLHRDAVDAYLAGREREAAQLREKIEADFDPTGLRARLLARRASEE
jgi:uncharacterized protein (DUF433 family)/flavin-binding protein dodecin